IHQENIARARQTGSDFVHQWKQETYSGPVIKDRDDNHDTGRLRAHSVPASVLDKRYHPQLRRDWTPVRLGEAGGTVETQGNPMPACAGNGGLELKSSWRQAALFDLDTIHENGQAGRRRTAAEGRIDATNQQPAFLALLPQDYMAGFGHPTVFVNATILQGLVGKVGGKIL